MPGKQRDNQAEYKQQILFIRHGESEAHIGKAATHIEVVGLTPSGKEHAQKIASEFTDAPDLIIVSPYLRAWETAGPTMKRFPATPHAIWRDVREFTYLGSLTGQCLTKQERSGKVDEYWGNAKPHARDGSAESFVEFIGRARRTLHNLRKELEEKNFIVVFTHEQFIRAVQCLLLEWEERAERKPERMKQFRKMLLDHPLCYGYKDDESWQRHILQQQVREQEKMVEANIPSGMSLGQEKMVEASIPSGMSLGQEKMVKASISSDMSLLDWQGIGINIPVGQKV